MEMRQNTLAISLQAALKMEKVQTVGGSCQFVHKKGNYSTIPPTIFHISLGGLLKVDFILVDTTSTDPLSCIVNNTTEFVNNLKLHTAIRSVLPDLFFYQQVKKTKTQSNQTIDLQSLSHEVRAGRMQLS